MTLELRGSARPTLQQALRWIGSRVDDIYGASIGKLEDIWMDPDSGEPLWLLVRDGRIGGRHTLVPFAQAASGAGHVWIPFEREVVRGAPAVRPSAPLSHELSDTLRRYYAESGHPVTQGAGAEAALRVEAPEPARIPEQPRAPEPAAAARATSQTGAIPAASQRRPAPPPPASPPRHEPRRHQGPSHNHAPAEPPPLPPMPPRTPPRREPHQAASDEGFAAPRPQEPWTPARRPSPLPPPTAPPSEPSRFNPAPSPSQATPPPAPAAAPDELRLTVGEGVDMELVGRLQFRGNIVRVQPLPQGADSQQ